MTDEFKERVKLKNKKNGSTANLIFGDLLVAVVKKF